MGDSEILEAVDRLKQAEEEVENRRKVLGEILLQARSRLNVTELSRLTEINRPRIYWLMERSRHEGNNRNNRSGKGN